MAVLYVDDAGTMDPELAIRWAELTCPTQEANLDDKLAILLKHLPALRNEGVLRLKIDGIELELRPLMAEEPPKAEEPPAKRDPVTFGLPPGTKMPSLRERRGF